MGVTGPLGAWILFDLLLNLRLNTYLFHLQNALMLPPHITFHFGNVELNDAQLGHEGGEDHRLLCLVLAISVLADYVSETSAED